MSRAALAALAAGVVFVASGATRLAGGHYWDPATVADYLSIGLFSCGLLASGSAYLALARAAGGRAPWVAALIGAIGGIVGAVANVGEDWLRISTLGSWFFAGMLPWRLGGLALGASLAVRPRWRLRAVPPAVTFLAFGFVEGGVWLAAAALPRSRG